LMLVQITGRWAVSPRRAGCVTTSQTSTRDGPCHERSQRSFRTPGALDPSANLSRGVATPEGLSAQLAFHEPITGCHASDHAGFVCRRRLAQAALLEATDPAHDAHRTADLCPDDAHRTRAQNATRGGPLGAPDRHIGVALPRSECRSALPRPRWRPIAGYGRAYAAWRSGCGGPRFVRAR
jgi:hypothetical protein